MKNHHILTPYFLDGRSEGLDSLARSDWQINRPPLPDTGRQQRMIALYRPLRDKVANAINRGDRPVSVAGDCCASIGVLAGLQMSGLWPTLVWLDAHGDFNTWESSPSGFLGGMPLAMLVGRGEQTMIEGVETSTLPEEQVILTDARDLDPGEKKNLGNSAVTHLSEAESLFDHPLPGGPIWVHFDCDIINPEEAPSVSYSASGGPSVATLHRLFRHLANSGQIKAVSLSAWNPTMAEADRTRKEVLSLLDELL